MPLLKRRRVLAAKIESTAYTSEAPLADADCSFNVYDAVIQPTVEMVPRPRQGDFTNLVDSVGTQMGVCTFRTELTGPEPLGGTSPVWATTFLPACGWIVSGAVWGPVTEAPGSNVKTLTIEVYADGTKKGLRGAVGDFSIVLEAGKPGFIDWTFTGAYITFDDDDILSPTYPTELPLRWSNSTTQWGGQTAPCMQSLTINAGNNVIMRECQNAGDGTGYKGGLITNRRSTMTANPETDLLANSNPDWHDYWLASTTGDFTTALTDGTNTVTIDGTVQAVNIQEGDRNGMVTDEIEFLFVNGNSLDITFS